MFSTAGLFYLEPCSALESREFMSGFRALRTRLITMIRGPRREKLETGYYSPRRRSGATPPSHFAYNCANAAPRLAALFFVALARFSTNICMEE